MGEYIWTSVTFGGKICASDIADIRDELLGEDDLDEALENGMACTTSGETNYGSATELCSLLRELGLSYQLSSDRLGDYGGGISRWDASRCHMDASDGDSGDPYINLRDLKKMMDDGHSIGAAVVMLELVEKSIPPVELIEESAIPAAV